MPPQNLEQRVVELERVINDLRASTSIPFDIGEAIKERVDINELLEDSTSKSLTSEQHGAGAAGLKNPEAWLEIEINGTKYFIPAYT